MHLKERRQLLKASALAGASLISGSAALQALANSDNGMIFEFANTENPEWVNSQLPEKQVFEKLLGDIFWVRVDDYNPMVELTLEEIITTSQHAFVLRFHTTDPRKLDQVTHLIEHSHLGRRPMLLVANPVTKSEHLEGFEYNGEQREAKEFYYEASFNYMPIPAEQKALIPLKREESAPAI